MKYAKSTSVHVETVINLNNQSFVSVELMPERFGKVFTVRRKS